METISQKLIRNLKEGTFFKNVPVAVKNRLLKRVSTMNLFYFFDRERVMTKKYGEQIRKIGAGGVEIGNYHLHKQVKLDKDSIIYSLGIGTDIAFDLAIHRKYGCAVWMYDPTPESIAFMKQYDDHAFLKFHPLGVWVEDKIVRFYRPKLGGSSSLLYFEQSNDQYFDAECVTMDTIMKQNQHDHISVFKADIEGAALPILKQMIQKQIFPEQIVVEFERPRKDMVKIQDFFSEISDLRSRLKEAHYEEFLLPRKRSKYYSLEMLFVKKSKNRN